MHKYESKYTFGDTVYHKAETEKKKGLISSVQFSSGGTVTYLVSFGIREDQWCSEVELTNEYLKDFS